MARMMKKKGYRMGGMMKKGMKNGGKVNNLKKAIKKVNAKKKAVKNGKKSTMAQRMKALRARKKK